MIKYTFCLYKEAIYVIFEDPDLDPAFFQLIKPAIISELFNPKALENPDLPERPRGDFLNYLVILEKEPTYLYFICTLQNRWDEFDEIPQETVFPSEKGEVIFAKRSHSWPKNKYINGETGVEIGLRFVVQLHRYPYLN